MKKSTLIYLILACVFVSNVILAEFLGVKIFSLEETLGFKPLNYTLFGIESSLTYTAGVIIWPVVFILTDIVNDYYGRKGVRYMTLIAVAITIYAFIVSNIAIGLSPASWWQTIYVNDGLADYDIAYRKVFGQGNNIIIASLIAFVIGQITDVLVFEKIKSKYASSQSIWMRATASTLVSQLIDSFIVIYIAFYLGQNWPLDQVLSVALNNYIYKGLIAILLIPVLHLIHYALEKYFGKENAEKMRSDALKNTPIF